MWKKSCGNQEMQISIWLPKAHQWQRKLQNKNGRYFSVKRQRLTLFPGGPGGPASPDGPGGPWKEARELLNEPELAWIMLSVASFPKCLPKGQEHWENNWRLSKSQHSLDELTKTKSWMRVYTA